jgi:hypothetical protein
MYILLEEESDGGATPQLQEELLEIQKNLKMGPLQYKRYG